MRWPLISQPNSPNTRTMLHSRVWQKSIVVSLILNNMMTFHCLLYLSVDPCKNVHCGAGLVCKPENDVGVCVCVPECPEQSDPRRKVCTSLNETWSSDCEVHRARCLCDKNDPGCKSTELKHIQINYYGECREMPVCVLNSLIDFIERLRTPSFTPEFQ